MAYWINSNSNFTHGTYTKEGRNWDDGTLNSFNLIFSLKLHFAQIMTSDDHEQGEKNCFETTYYRSRKLFQLNKLKEMFLCCCCCLSALFSLSCSVKSRKNIPNGKFTWWTTWIRFLIVCAMSFDSYFCCWHIFSHRNEL